MCKDLNCEQCSDYSTCQAISAMEMPIGKLPNADEILPDVLIPWLQKNKDSPSKKIKKIKKLNKLTA
jgi:hypothetical protein